MNTDRWWDLHREDVAQAIEDAVTRTAGSGVDAALAASVREVLRPAVKAAPTGVAWPMTLDDLMALPLENPAPLPKRDQPGHVVPQGAILAALAQRIGERAESVSPRRVSQAMWGYAAPEGFPPAPIRGGRYSHDERMAIWNWMANLWPARQQLLALAGRIDAASALSAQVAAVFGNISGAGHSLRRSVDDSTSYAYWFGRVKIDGETPQDFVKSCAPLFALMRDEAKRMTTLLRHRDLLGTQDTAEGMDRQAELFTRIGGDHSFTSLLKSYTTTDLAYGNWITDEDMPPGYRLPAGSAGVLGDDFKIGGKVAPLSVQVAAYRNMQERRRAEGEAQARARQGLAVKLRLDIRDAIEGGATSVAKLQDALSRKGWQAVDKYGVMDIERGQEHVARLNKPYMADARKFAGLPAKEKA